MIVPKVAKPNQTSHLQDLKLQTEEPYIFILKE